MAVKKNKKTNSEDRFIYNSEDEIELINENGKETEKESQEDEQEENNKESEED